MPESPVRTRLARLETSGYVDFYQNQATADQPSPTAAYRFVRSATFNRERRHVGSVHVTLGPAKIGGAVGFTCRVRVWSHYLGLITADDVGDTLRTAVQQACLRVRSALRRRLHKRHDGARRISQRQNSRPDLSDYEARFF